MHLLLLLLLLLLLGFVRVLKGTDIVFHHASPPVAVSDCSLFYKVNVEETRTLIEACKESGVEV